MADKKISQLEQATTPLQGGELVPIVQNGETVRVEVDNLRAETSEFVKDSELADVATSGDYNDLENLPTIPTTDNFVEKSGETMTGALNIDASGTALSVPNGRVIVGLGIDYEINFQSVEYQTSIPFLGQPGHNTMIGHEKYGTLFGTLNGGEGYIQQGRIDGIASAYDLLLNPRGGKVGINTTDPQAKLDVNGDLRTHSLLEKSKNGSVSGGSYLLDWNAYGNHDIIITQNTEIMQGDIPPLGYSQVITLNIIGDYALTLPVEWEIKNGGTYDGVNGSQIVVQSWDNGNFYTVIN